MAAVRGTVQGFARSGNPKASIASRLGHDAVVATADTWRTFARVETRRNGSVTIEVKRDGATIFRKDIDPE